MPDLVIKLIFHTTHIVIDLPSLAELMKSQWVFFELLGSEVLEVVNLTMRDINSAQNYQKNTLSRGLIHRANVNFTNFESSKSSKVELTGCGKKRSKSRATVS
jgi:hypothetical protein